MTYTPGSVSADAVLDNVLKSLTGTIIVPSTRPVHLVHFLEEMARHLTTNQNQNSPYCFKKISMICFGRIWVFVKIEIAYQKLDRWIMQIKSPS